VVGGVVLEIRGRPIDTEFFAGYVGFIVKPAFDTVKESSVYVLGSVECGQCLFQTGEGLAASLKDKFVGATKDMILIFIIWGWQSGSARTVGASLVIGGVSVVHSNASGGAIVGKFDDTRAFKIFELTESGKKGGPCDGVKGGGRPVGMLFDDLCAEVLFAMVTLKESAGVPSNGNVVVVQHRNRWGGQKCR